jgi:hypothetical protein
MLMTPERRAREFVEVGFRDLGAPSLEPYIAIIAELIAEVENDALERAAEVADEEYDQKPIVAPLTNAAYDEAARTIAANIRALQHKM